MKDEKVTPVRLREKKKEGGRITALTAYDFATATLLDETGIDMILVGDSLGMVVLGYENTIPVTVEEMLHHTKAVARGVKRALVVADMPFLSYPDARTAIENAGRFVKEGAAAAVKIEGGMGVAPVAEALVKAGVPVVAHIGLTPQEILKMGKYKVQGRGTREAERLLADAKALEERGAFAIILECVPAGLGGRITKALSIPTIGIGAGPHCDGQILVTHDLLGLFRAFRPKFVKAYAELTPVVRQAISQYREEVESGEFPGPEHCY